MSGQGVARYANGDVYDGSFVRGRRQGPGTMRYANGQEASGDWADGAILTRDIPATETPAETAPASD